jgi:Transposase DDE domain
MSASIVQAVARIKRNVAQCLSEASIEQACRDAGYTWRERTLGPAQTIWAFLLQVLHGNTACAHTLRLARLTCTSAAYCGARMRLPLAVLERLAEATCRAARSSCATALWHGHRTFLVDGSSFSMPDTALLRAHFGQSGRQAAGCGFPTAHLLAMFDASSGLLLKALALPLRTHDHSQVAKLHPELSAGDVLVGDRGFCSYAHLALLLRDKLHGLLRVHQRQLVSFRRDRCLRGKTARGTVAQRATGRLIRKLARFDQIVEYDKPATCPAWMSPDDYAALPETIRVRELRYHTKVRGFRTRAITLVTTLLDAGTYSREELAALYRRRWEIETNLGHLKTTMRLDILRCKTVDGVRKELAVYALVYNLTRLVILAAAETQQVPLAQISFVDALRWLAEACDHQPPLLLRVNPHRPNRLEPRVRKRRPKEYDLMTKPRRQLRELLLQKRHPH